MSDFLRKYWFVCLIAIAMIGILIFYIADLNKDNVSGKQTDGKDVVASTSLGDVTSDEIFDSYQNFNRSLLYYMYQDAVVNEAVETTSDMQKEADAQAKTLETNLKAASSDQTYYQFLRQLAGFGYAGEKSIPDYCLTSLKLQQLERDYISEHESEYMDSVTTDPMEISILTVAVDSADEPTEEQKTKMENVDKALEDGSFEDAVKAFSEDAATAANDGYVGYVDSSSSSVPQEIKDAIKDMKKGDISDWITVTDSQTGAVTEYRVYINETDFKNIYNSENEDTASAALNALLTSNPGLEMKTVQDAAEKLGDKVKFDSDEVKEQIESYIEAQIGGQDDESK